MLDQNYLNAIRTIMKEELGNTENELLEESGLTQTYLEEKITEVKKNIDELNQYCRISKLESDNTTLLLKMIEELSRRIEDLERKSA